MQTWTIRTILAERPCRNYMRPRGGATPLLRRLMGRRRRVTILTVAKDRRIPVEHRIWLACRRGDHIRSWLDRVVTRALRRHALHCGIKAVEVWAAQWPTRAETDTAWAAAWARAAWATAWGAAEKAAAKRAAAKRAAAWAVGAAVWMAAWATEAMAESAWRATDGAVRAARMAAGAEEAAGVEAGAEETREQIRDLIAVLESVRRLDRRCGR
jgi:hypothetical protein